MKRKSIQFITIATLLILGIFLLPWDSRLISVLRTMAQQGPATVTLTQYASYEFNSLNHPTGVWGTLWRYSNPYPSPVAPTTQLMLFIADSGNHTIKRFFNGSLSTAAGLNGTSGYVDGAPADSRFSYPTGLAGQVSHVQQNGYPFPLIRTKINLFVDDTQNYVVRKICSLGNAVSDDCQSNVVQTVCGSHSQGLVDGSGASACFSSVAGLSILVQPAL